jgi:hypothetical protein
LTGTVLQGEVMKRVQDEVQVCFTTVDGQGQPLDVAVGCWRDGMACTAEYTAEYRTELLVVGCRVMVEEQPLKQRCNALVLERVAAQSDVPYWGGMRRDGDEQ